MIILSGGFIDIPHAFGGKGFYSKVRKVSENPC